jgi:hypothetical protein
MANVRCPMCSKFNPPEADACSYCGARLKPVRPPSQEPSSQSPAVPPPDSGLPAGDAPDWLSGLRTDGLSDLSPGQPDAGEQDSGADTPDWLLRIRGREQSDLEPSGPDEAEPADLPDWMSALSPSQPDSAQDLDLPDWSANLPPASSSSAPAFGGEEIDWLGGLNLDPEPPSAQTGPASKPQQDVPTQSFGLTDFLREQGEIASQQTDEPASSSQPPDSGADFDFSSFLSGPETQESGAAPLSQQPDSPDVSSWFSSFQSTPEDDPLPPSDSASSAAPGWLSGGFEDPETTPTPPASDSGVPSWLGADFGAADSAPPPPAAESDVPSWLSGDFGSADPAPTTPASDSGVPSWLSGGFDAPGEPAPQEPEADAGMPAWLGGFAAHEPEPKRQEPETAESQIPDWMSSFSAAETGPSEIPPLKVEASQPPVETPSPDPSGGEKEPFIDEEAPDWLRDFSSAAPTEGETVSPLISPDQPAVPVEDAGTGQPFAIDLPDWLSEESMPQAEQPEDVSMAAPVEELAQAELPEWVREMRPIEAAMAGDHLTSEAEERIEKAGPLAGLRGVLPADDFSVHYRKPPVYSVKLKVSEKQRGQASLLESIVSQETQPLLIQPPRVHAIGIIPRVLVALLLIAVLIVPRLLEMQPLGIPVLYPVEMLDMFEQIEQETSQMPVVLLAVDFEPGRAGEMQLAASPVIEHLMAREMNLVVVSTVPNGPALAQRLLANAARQYQQQTQQNFDLNTRSVNLGYLPGGAISLLEFAQYPRRSAPADVRGSRAVWSNSFLQDIYTLGDFSQIIVLTDSAETGRAWVEQVQPLMGDVPLFVVTSAQASPLLMPYLESGQIAGLVSGMIGGAMYSRLIYQGSGVSEGFLATYQVGMLLAFGLVLAGGLFSGSRLIFRRRTKDEA